MLDRERAIVAIDFDGTIADTSYPKIHGLFPLVKEALVSLKENGCYIIIWTCRSGEVLEEAVNFLSENEVPFDSVNSQHPGLIEIFKDDTRKISCDIYVDDKCISSLKNKPFPNWRELTRDILNVVNHKDFNSILNHKN